jgi:3-dehydroquinate synthase
VAIGVAIDVVYSSLKLGLPEADARRTLDCLRRLGFTLDHPALDDGDVLIDGMEEFRQHLGGRLTLTMLEGVGQPIDVHEFDRDAMRLAIERARSESSERRRSPGSTPPSVS